MNYDRFASKNAAVARDWVEAERTERPQKKRAPAEPKLGICDRCHEEKLVLPFRTRRTERMEGAATYGVVVMHYCEDCSPKNRRDENAPPPPSGRQVKNLLKGMKKRLR